MAPSLYIFIFLIKNSVKSPFILSAVWPKESIYPPCQKKIHTFVEILKALVRESQNLLYLLKFTNFEKNIINYNKFLKGKKW